MLSIAGADKPLQTSGPITFLQLLLKSLTNTPIQGLLAVYISRFLPNKPNFILYGTQGLFFYSSQSQSGLVHVPTL